MFKTFIDKCVSGEIIDLDTIDDWVDAWHTDTNGEEPLHEFLGMTWEEYGLWVCHPSVLDEIIEVRRNK